MNIEQGALCGGEKEKIEVERSKGGGEVERGTMRRGGGCVGKMFKVDNNT